MLSLIMQGIGFGFYAGTSPGPFQSFLVNVTLTQGWRKSIIIIVTPLITDGPIILLMTFLLKDLPPEVKRLIQIAGGLLLWWIAWGAWQKFRAPSALISEGNPASDTQRKTLLQAVTMNFLSPGPYIFWGTITGPLLIRALEDSILTGGLFLLAFYGTFLPILALWVLVFDRVRQLSARVSRVILVVTIVLLLFLGGSLLAQGIGITT